MSTWGCYFFSPFFFIIAMWSVYYFLRKYWMYSKKEKKKKKRQETHADTDFSSEDFKNGNRIQKSFNVSKLCYFFVLFLTPWRRNKSEDGYSWTHCLYNPGRTNSDFFLFHTGALVVYKPHGYLWVQFIFLQFLLYLCSHIWVGFASALLPYGHLWWSFLCFFCFFVFFWWQVAGFPKT